MRMTNAKMVLGAFASAIITKARLDQRGQYCVTVANAVSLADRVALHILRSTLP